MAKPPPYIGAKSALFIEADGPVYALIGTILDRTKVLESDPVHILVAPDTVREYESLFLPMFEFFQTPREENQVREWLAWAGGDEELLRTLIETRAIVRVDTRNSMTSARSLKGLRIIPQCTPDIASSSVPGRFDVKRDESSSEALSINAELGEALWGAWEQADLPSVIDEMARKFNQPTKQVARRILSSIPIMLQYGYARLEWLNVPRV